MQLLSVIVCGYLESATRPGQRELEKRGAALGSTDERPLSDVRVWHLTDIDADGACPLSGVGGLLHWAWWFPFLCGAIAALTREASQGFLLTRQCGSGYLIRSITTTCLFCGVVAMGAHMLSIL